MNVIKINNVDENKIGNIYFFSDMQYIKIGFTTETIQKRMSRLKTGNPKDIYCLCNYKGTILQEKELHKTFIKDRVRDNGEWFYPSSEIIDYINKINKE